MAEHSKEMSINHNSKNFGLDAKGWMIVSIVLAVILIGSAAFSYAGNVGKDKAGDLVEDYLYNQGLTARVSSVNSVSGLYEADVTVGGQSGTLYLTKDGKYIGSMDLLDTSITTSGSTLGGTTASAEIPIGDSPVIGNPDANVTVVEFSDFSCPFCAAASGDNPQLTAYMKQNNPSWEPIVSNLMEDYVDTGKVRFVVKYTMGHSGGHPAQEVAWCLNEQGLYWKFYPKAFANQDDVEDLDKMIALAKTVGANSAKLQTCLDSGKYDDRFAQEQSEGSAAGVSGTPAFFVNGRLIEGAVPYSQVKAVIESELAKN